MRYIIIMHNVFLSPFLKQVLSYHASSSLEETEKIMVRHQHHRYQHTHASPNLLCLLCLSQQLEVPSVNSIQLDTFEMDDLPLSDDETVLASVRMFMECGHIERFRIEPKVQKSIFTRVLYDPSDKNCLCRG